MYYIITNKNNEYYYNWNCFNCETGLHFYTKVERFELKHSSDTMDLDSCYIRALIDIPDEKLKLYKSYGFNITILGERHYLYDPKTIKKFNLNVNNGFVAIACFNGDIKFLEWWKNSDIPLEYSESALNLASKNGHVKVLEWWKNSGLELKYCEYSLYFASGNGHLNVLKWWKKSGLKLKYDEHRLLEWAHEWTRHTGGLKVINWWKHSGLIKLPLKKG
jgi:hypothetical protein